MSQDDNSELGGGVEFKRRNSLFLPLEVLGVIVFFGAVILWFLIGPSFQDLFGDSQKPTASTSPVDIKINAVPFRVPANYLPQSRNREGGEQEEVRIEGLLPDLRGFTDAEAAAFQLNTPTAQLVQITLTPNKSAMSEKDLFERVLVKLTAKPEGEPGPNGLTRFVFPEGSGKEDTEMFTFSAGEGALIVLQCEKEADPATGPSCQRVTRIEDNIALKYRFKRAHLGQWPSIDQGILRLVQGFRQASGS